MSEDRAVYDEVLSHFDAPPVLVDVGASGDPPAIWSGLAKSSVFVGFDPDLRDMRESDENGYRRCIIINEAVTDRPDADDVRFYLTSSPYCSSTLVPDEEALAQYVFADLFKVESEVFVRATTLDKVVRRIGLPKIDWLKVDSQGTDLRLFTGLSDGLKAGVLAIDVEPGLIDAYRGEDLYVDAHTALTRSGFWLSTVDVKGTVRLKTSTRVKLRDHRSDLDVEALQRAIRTTPCWCEARYLRTIESLADRDASERDYALLWIFAMVDAQLGFALDIAFDFKRRFPESRVGPLLLHQSMARLECALPPKSADAAEQTHPLRQQPPAEPLPTSEQDHPTPATVWRRLHHWLHRRR